MAVSPVQSVSPGPVELVPCWDSLGLPGFLPGDLGTW